MVLVKKENIKYNLQADNRDGVIKQLCALLYTNGYIKSEVVFYDAVMKREFQISTGIGNGFAIPHGVSVTVNESSIAVAILKKPVEWLAIDGFPVRYVFLLAIEDNIDSKNSVHLKALATIAEKMIDEAFLKSISNAQSQDEIYEAINN